MKVFVSHSARNDPIAIEVRDAVKRGLAGHEVFVDEDVLEPGDEWRAVLYHWLAESHAAVVLLNRQALTSSWVRREVNILLWRRALRNPLDPLDPLWIVPAYIGDVGRRDLEAAGLGDLAELQIARLGPRERPEDLAAKIVGRFGKARDPDGYPMGKWAKAVAYDLKHVGDQDSLVAAARELQVEETDLDRVRDSGDGCRFLAHQLLARWHGRGLRLAIGEIADFTPAEWLSRLIDNVAATWVDGEAARMLLKFDASQPGTALLNAVDQSTAAQYIDRATCYARERFACATVNAVAGESFLEEFEDQCTKAVRRMLFVHPSEKIEDYVPPGGTPDRVLFLIVDPSTTPLKRVAEGVRAVRGRFPWLVIVLLTRDTLPTDEDLAAWQLTDARRLVPALAPGEEKTARQVVGELNELREDTLRHLGRGAA